MNTRACFCNNAQDFSVRARYVHTALQLAGYEVHIHEISLPLTSHIQASKTLEANESLEAVTDHAVSLACYQSSNLCGLKTDTVRLDTR